MPNPGNSGVADIAYYPGSPVGVSTSILNISKGTLVIDYVTPAIYQRTSASDNSAFNLLAAASGAITPSGIAATGAITSSSPSGGVGYATGAGGAVTQASSKSTGVTLNTTTGAITMNAASLAAGAEVAFTLTNSSIGAADVIIVNVKSGGTSAGYSLSVTAVAASSCEITLTNLTGGALAEAIILSFIVLKGAIA